jgi:mannose-6-phosphate isomerase-like protein (cupin superfamily)
MKRAENQPETLSLVVFGGIYYRVWSVPDAETILPQHAHRYDHLTALLRGTVQVWCGPEMVGVFTAPATIRIPAHRLHSFRTLTRDCMLACIHNADHADPDGEPVIAERHDLILED